MLDIIWQFIKTTPWWVLVLCIFLLMRGVRALKSTVANVYTLFIVPCLLIMMSLHTILYEMPVMVSSIAAWLFATAIGVLIGAVNTQARIIRLDKKNASVEFRGGASTLILFTLIFTSEYYFGYRMAVDPEIVNYIGFDLAFMGISGFCSGIFLGRIIYILMRLLVSE